MKKILVPIDFSPASRNASEYAALLSKAAGAEIHLLHVYKDLIPATVGPEPWTVTVSDLQSKNETLLNNEIKYLEDKYTVKASGNVRRGLKGNSINKIAKEIAADLIIMGMKGDWKARTSGTTILKTIRKTDAPVLIIPEATAFSPIKNIVLAVDFTEMTDSSCFELLFSIVKIFDASLRVLHVEKKGADINPSEVPEKLQLGRDLSKVSYMYDKIETNDVDQGIQQFVQNHPTDLLAMVAHHHTILEQLFGLLHTRSVSLEVEIPLLVLKSSAY